MAQPTALIIEANRDAQAAMRNHAWPENVRDLALYDRDTWRHLAH